MKEVIDKKKFLHAFNDSCRNAGITGDVARKVRRWIKKYTIEIEDDSEDNLEDDYDWCYECTGYGDDYHEDANGDLVSSCPDCPHNHRMNKEDT